MASNAVAIVFAVNCPPHAPAPGQAMRSSSASFASLIVPALCAPTASKTSPIVTSRPSNRPGRIEPPYSISPGTSSRARAMTLPGIVLSQPEIATSASS